MKSKRAIYYIGQRLEIPYEEKEGRKIVTKYKRVQIIDLYTNFALCKVNGRYNECYPYDVLEAAV